MAVGGSGVLRYELRGRGAIGSPAPEVPPQRFPPQRFQAIPARSPEAAGFYLSDDVSDFEVSFRTAIHLLSQGGYLLDFEDKYANEMLYLVAEDRSIFPNGAGLSRENRDFETSCQKRGRRTVRRRRPLRSGSGRQPTSWRPTPAAQAAIG